MKINEYLKDIEGENVSKEQLTKIFGDNDLVLNGIPKDKFNDELGKSKSLKSQLDAANLALEEFKKTAGTNTELLTQIENLKNDLAAKDAEFAKNTKSNALIAKLTSEGVAYPELLLSHIDLDKITDVNTFDSKDLKAKFPNLFPKETTEGAGSTNTGVHTQTVTKDILIKQYEAAEKAGNFAAMLSIQQQIKQLPIPK